MTTTLGRSTCGGYATSTMSNFIARNAERRERIATTMDDPTNIGALAPAACQCDQYAIMGGACICPPIERAVRFIAKGQHGTRPMTAEQRQWCRDEVNRSICFTPDVDLSDAELASEVLDAWAAEVEDHGL